MPMERERHEEILGRLLDGELPADERTELLQELRADYTKVHDDHTKHSETIEKLEKDNTHLVKSNSALFHQLGVADDPALKKQEEEKSFSETVTISDLEKNAQ